MSKTIYKIYDMTLDMEHNRLLISYELTRGEERAHQIAIYIDEDYAMLMDEAVKRYAAGEDASVYENIRTELLSDCDRYLANPSYTLFPGLDVPAVIPGFNTATTLYDTLPECLEAAMKSVLDYQGQPDAIALDRPYIPIINTIGEKGSRIYILGFEGNEEIYSIDRVGNKYTFDSIP